MRFNTALIQLAALAVLSSGCAAIKRSAIEGEIRSALLELNAPPDASVTKLADDLYTYKWYSYRTAFVTTPEGVIVFDPLNATAAAELAKEIQKVAPNPTIRYVVYSHAHADHAEGARALGGTPVIVAHANAARDLKRHPDPEIVPPTETFDGEGRDLTLGGVTLKLIHVPFAHTDGMVAIHIPHRRALYEVDMAFVKMVPPVGAPYSSFHGQTDAIERMQTLDYDTVIPGHGAYGTKQDVANYLTLLREMEGALRTAATKNGLTRFHGDATFFTDPKAGPILFAALDALEPKYSSWQGWDHHMVQALQWAFFYGVYMNE